MSIFDKFSLKENVSIVTGSAMGLGKSMAIALAEAGSNIVIADINFNAAKETAREIKEIGVRALPVEVDVTSEHQINRMVNLVMDEFGKIDSLFNNAGIVIHKNLEDNSFDDWYKVINVNLNSVFLVSKAVGKIMIKQKKGTIINTSSMSGIIVNTPQSQCSYNVSKAGVIMLTKSLASEWAKHNIRVNTIAPGYMKTELTRPFFEENGMMVQQWMDLTPMGRPGNPEELQGIAVYLASEASSFVTGGVYVIDGGYSVW